MGSFFPGSDNLYFLTFSKMIYFNLKTIPILPSSNLVNYFSFYIHTSKSKTKCLLFCGRSGKIKYPECLQVCGESLPWVESADHLGHRLHQMTNMEKDCLRARARYVTTTSEVRKQLEFAYPEQTLQALQVLCTDAYGSMLWDLGSDTAEQYFKCRNTSVKLI